MTKKISPSPHVRRKPPDTAMSKKADPITEKLSQHLADTPALTAAGVLANMLLDTEDSATRLAIMRTRIQVLRARTIACQLGRPVAGNITLGEVFSYQASTDQQLLTLGSEASASDTEPKADIAPHAEPPAEPVKARLLKTYTHEGIELPEGGVFLVSAHSAKELTKLGICEILDDRQTSDTPEDREHVK